jgi:Lon protease-like protein
MVLPNSILFPYSMLPLFIFEERYREMLSYCLERNRMFCIALMRPGVASDTDDDDFYDVAGLGLIRACVGNEDGTSQLILQGLARVRLTNFVQYEPFRIAQIRELKSKRGDDLQSEALTARVLELCHAIKEKSSDLENLLNKQLAQTSDPEVISDFVAQAFVPDAMERQEILEELSVNERLRMLIEILEKD